MVEINNNEDPSIRASVTIPRENYPSIRVLSDSSSNEEIMEEDLEDPSDENNDYHE
jgi:hypothetical protein